jgi:hypothetical protein
MRSHDVVRKVMQSSMWESELGLAFGFGKLVWNLLRVKQQTVL